MFEDDCDGNDDPPPMGQFVTISKNRKEKLDNMRITLPGTDSGGTNKESQEITTNTEDCYIDDDDL